MLPAATCTRHLLGDVVPRADTEAMLPRPEFLARLRRYTAGEVAVNNKYRQLFSGLPSWSSWVEDVLQDLLQVPGGSQVAVTVINELDGEDNRNLVFTQKEVSIGRGPDNDISLHLQSISRKHARMFERHGDYFIEDLHSTAGTYVNRRKVDPDRASPLRPGDEVLIFPYVLKVTPRDLWNHDEQVQLTYSSMPMSLHAAEFAAEFSSEMCLFRIDVHPGMGQILLAMSRPLVQTMIARLLRGREVGLVEADRELLEFVAACVLERANRALAWPFECSLNPLRGEVTSNETGLKIEVAVRLTQAHGCIRLFLPGSFLEQIPKQERSLSSWMKAALLWRLSLRAGFADIEAAELQQVEAGDVLVYTPRYELVLPIDRRRAVQERGWRVTQNEANARQFFIEHFYEWSQTMPEEGTQSETKQQNGVATLADLPVRVHVVLGCVDLDLKHLEDLAEGSIVELEGESQGTVQLVTGNTVLGSGELVELDDHRLGVQVTRWRER